MNGTTTALRLLYYFKRDLHLSKGAFRIGTASQRLTAEVVICSLAGGERVQHGKLHAFSCLPCASAAAVVAHTCCPATEPNSYRPNRYHLDDRLTSSHVIEAPHVGRRVSR